MRGRISRRLLEAGLLGGTGLLAANGIVDGVEIVDGVGEGLVLVAGDVIGTGTDGGVPTLAYGYF